MNVLNIERTFVDILGNHNSVENFFSCKVDKRDSVR